MESNPSDPILSQQNIFRKYLLFILALTVSIVISLIFGYYVGNTNKTELQNSSVGKNILSPSPLITSQPEFITPIAKIPLTNFQQILLKKCKDTKDGKKKILISELPFKIDNEKVKLEDKEYAECEYNKNTNTSSVHLSADYGRWGLDIEIYDNLSIKELTMGDGPLFNYEDLQQKYNPEIAYIVFLGATDYIPPLTEEQVYIQIIRKIVLKNYDRIYVRTKHILIPPGDNRLVTLLKKYKSSDVKYSDKKERIDIAKYDEINKDINTTFFGNMDNLQEPEKTNFNEIMTALNGITSK